MSLINRDGERETSAVLVQQHTRLFAQEHAHPLKWQPQSPTSFATTGGSLQKQTLVDMRQSFELSNEKRQPSSLQSFVSLKLKEKAFDGLGFKRSNTTFSFREESVCHMTHSPNTNQTSSITVSDTWHGRGCTSSTGASKLDHYIINPRLKNIPTQSQALLNSCNLPHREE